jgi:hypothetical protein
LVSKLHPPLPPYPQIERAQLFALLERGLSHMLMLMGYRLSPDDLAILTIEVNTRRERILSAYDKLDCPVELVLATKTAGEKGERAERKNALWRSGSEHLASIYPTLPLHWLDNTHLLPFKEPTKLAKALGEFVQRTRSGDLRDARRDSELGKRTC